MPEISFYFRHSTCQGTLHLRSHPTTFLVLAIGLFISPLLMPSKLPGNAIDFNRQIRPILSEHCFRCHGPDDAAREAELRLDTPEGQLEDLGGHAAIVPGSPHTSEMMRRVQSQDDAERMPPPEAKRPLLPSEIELLRKWIEQGAPWSSHWSFTPPKKPAVPTVPGTVRSHNSIDSFIQMELKENVPQLPVAPAADRVTLLRRVMLDLIGLPPTPDEVAAFLQDKSPDAYERLVDRLLASPHYGERWGRLWLDLARYADTNGYEKDRERNIWPFRDWVVRALNSDMPYDQFTIEQLAGDLLPNATPQQRVATGFHRNTMLNEEGGIDPLEYRFHAMTDRVATTGVVWLGLTTGCAQCHTHKYDPVTQHEYYGLMALLNNADETDLQIRSAQDDLVELNRLNLSRQLLQELPQHWPAANPQMPTVPNLEDAFAAWLQQMRSRVVSWKVLTPEIATSNTLQLAVAEDGTVSVWGDSTKNDRFQITYRLDQPVGDQLQQITAIRLEAIPDPRLPGGGPGLGYYEGPKGDFRLKEFRLLADTAPVKFSQATHSNILNRFDQEPQPLPQLYDGELKSGFSFRDVVRTDKEEHSPDGHRVLFMFQLENPLSTPQQLTVEMDFDHYYSSALGKFRILATASPQKATAYNFSDHLEALLRLPPDKLDPSQRNQLRDAFLLQAPQLREQAQRIHNLRAPTKPTETLVMAERPAEHPRPTYLHTRGEFTLPAELVTPHVPAALQTSDSPTPRNRLEFARWLVAQKNPLPARVWVNRNWAALIGQGIVRTLEDFGAQGAPPTHPDLLDWLATRAVEQKWSTKQLHRLIVSSHTYRQSTSFSAEHVKFDPDNRWLARMSRRRLEGELLRDTILSSSGLLTRQMSGPSVRPPQPTAVVEDTYDTPTWTPDSGANRYRRSIYTFQKRSAPFAMYAAFDAPSGEACVARRDVSNSPLQALTLLNDDMFLEAARSLGQQLSRHGGSDSQKVAEGMRQVVTRDADPDEIGLLCEFVATQRLRFSQAPNLARDLLGHSVSADSDAANSDATNRDSDSANRDAANGESDGHVEDAVWVALARTLFNLDELINRN
ncbi:MAG: PSD1 and planctomycete cytochrome C domain-containing protein [Planctomycetota bacterium]|nr:PSD1 and planctomycete cytochrome C domain-containing protein [Planctomycetota bacterium]MDA1178817.1 PSD1 and planctomycete cytochrome C domain-containing protein [Planctomycetota bacterium]